MADPLPSEYWSWSPTEKATYDMLHGRTYVRHAGADYQKAYEGAVKQQEQQRQSQASPSPISSSVYPSSGRIGLSEPAKPSTPIQPRPFSHIDFLVGRGQPVTVSAEYGAKYIREQADKQVKDIDFAFKRIDESKTYIVGPRAEQGEGKIVKGSDLKKEYKEQYESAREQRKKTYEYTHGMVLGEYAPGSTITIGKDRYMVNLPYEGAEKYKETKKFLKEDPFTALSVSFFSPENKFLLESGFEYLFGSPEKAEQKIVESLITRSQAIQDVFITSERKTKPFSAEMYGKFLKTTFVDNPAVQVAGMFYGSAALKSISGFAKGAAIVKYGAGASKIITAGKIGSYSLFGGVAAYQTYDIGATYMRGDKTEALSKTALFGINVAAAGMGWRSVSKKSMMAWESAGKSWYMQRKGVSFVSDIAFGRRGELVGTVSDIKAFQSRGTPIELNRYRIGEISIYKMGGPKQVYISFPGEKLPSMASGFRANIGYPRAVETYLKTTPSGEYLADKVLFGGGRLTFFKGMFSGSKKFGVGVRWAEVETFSQRGLLETGGFGGIAKTAQKTVMGSVIGNVPKSMFQVDASSMFKPFVIPVDSSYDNLGYVSEIKTPTAISLSKYNIFFDTQKSNDRLLSFSSMLFGEKSATKGVDVLGFSTMNSERVMDDVFSNQMKKQDRIQAQINNQIRASVLKSSNMSSYGFKKVTFRSFIPYIWSLPSGGESGNVFGTGTKLGKGYRYRKWKVPELEDLFPRSNKKSGKKDKWSWPF